MNKQESYKTYMILMISSDGNQNNVFLFMLATNRHFVRFLGRRYRPPTLRLNLVRFKEILNFARKIDIASVLFVSMAFREEQI